MPAGVPAPYPQNPFAETALSPDQALAYLARIKLPASTLDEPPSLDLLTRVFTAQTEHVPKDTSPLHIANWDDDPDADVVLGSSLKTGMPCGVLSHDLIVRQNKGAFCFSINVSHISRSGARREGGREKADWAECMHRRPCSPPSSARSASACPRPSRAATRTSARTQRLTPKATSGVPSRT